MMMNHMQPNIHHLTLITIHSSAFINNNNNNNNNSNSNSNNNVEISRAQHSRMATYLTSILALLSFIVPVLVHLIDLKFKKEAQSVFVVVSSLLAFVLAFGLVSIFHTPRLSPTRAALLHATMVFSASLSLALLASLLFPDAFQPLLYVLYALISLGNFHNLVWKWCHWVHRTIIDNLLEPALTVMRRQWHTRRRPSSFTP